MFRKLLKVVIALILLCLVAATAVLGYRYMASARDQADLKQLDLLMEVMQQVKEHYVEEVDGKKLIQDALKGMLGSLDPHSTYMPASDFKEMNVQISGTFGGLGIEINMKDDKLLIVSPIDDTPADRAGLKAGDHIFKIDGTLTKGLTLNEAVNKMRGPKGTKVTLTILREGTGEPLVFPLVRDIIRTKSLKAKTLEPGFGYVRIAHFQERTGEDFEKALATLKEENGGALKGLVLDLRNNPGGLLDQSVRVANRFLGDRADNALVVYTDGRAPGSKQTYNASIGDKEPRYPLVVLVNGGSASASEIVAGALQDQKRALIMGTQTFGKGSVQSILPMPEGAGLKLTTARYYTPSGRSIQVKGITPDIIVNQLAPPKKPGEKGKMPEFHEADLMGHLPGDGEVPEKKPAPVDSRKDTKKPTTGPQWDDYQLYRAVELLKGLRTVTTLEEKK